MLQTQLFLTGMEANDIYLYGLYREKNNFFAKNDLRQTRMKTTEKNGENSTVWFWGSKEKVNVEAFMF